MRYWLAMAAVIFGAMGGCSDDEEARPKWKCSTFSAAYGCECGKSVHVAPDWTLDACGPTECCVAGQYQDGDIRKCVCHSQQFLEARSFTCADALEYDKAIFASATPWHQVSACPSE
jgi:hypothetical protein